MNNCVYWIHHPSQTDITSQGYVGVTSRFDRRMFEHKKLTSNKYLVNAIKKYGWDNLIKEKIVIASATYCLEIELKIRPNDKIGWNLVKGGNKPPINKWNLGTKGIVKAWNKGIKCSDEVKNKISKNLTNLWKSEEYRNHMSNVHKGQKSPMKDKTHSKESLLKMSKSKIGKPSGKKGIKMSQEHIEKMKKLSVEESWICPHCFKQGKSKGAGNRWHFNNCKGKK